MRNDVFIGKGRLARKGVYANRNFKKGEIVISYNLTPLTEAQFENLPKSERMFTHKQKGIIYLYSEPERYVNHSAIHNTYQDLVVKADIALVNIKKGEMITTDATKDDLP